jgi:thymidylate kinase
MLQDKGIEFLRRIFFEFDKYKLKYVVLRNYESLPYSLESKDLDLCLRSSDLKRAIHIISKAAEALGFRRLVIRKWEGIYSLCIINNSNSLMVDLLLGFHNRGRIIISAEELFESGKFQNGIRVPDPVYEAIMLLLRWILTGGNIKEKYWEKIRAVCKSRTQEFKLRLKRLVGKKLSEMIFNGVAENNRELIKRNRLKISGRLYVRALINSPFNFFSRFCMHFICEFVKMLKGGYTIAVLGPDGVGKTTFVKYLVEVLKSKLAYSDEYVREFHFRPNLLPNISRLFENRRKEEFQDAELPYTKPPAGFVSSLLRIAYYTTDFILGYYKKVVPHFRTHKFVIFDRYSYEILCDPERSRIKLPLWIRKVFFAFIPKPRWTFVLLADPEIVLSRKSELTKERISLLIDRYKTLVNGKGVYYLNAGRLPEDLAKEAFELILHDISVPL